MELSKIRIASERILLQPISMEYREDIFSEFTQDVSAYMIHRPAQDIAETEILIQNSMDNLRRKTDLELVILQQGSMEFLGCVSLLKLDSKNPAFRIWLRESAHGNRYGLEAVTAVKQWADEHLQYRTLLYPVDKANIPSRRIPENLGGIPIREYNLLSLSGKILNVLEYAIPSYVRIGIGYGSKRRTAGNPFAGLRSPQPQLALSAT